MKSAAALALEHAEARTAEAAARAAAVETTDLEETKATIFAILRVAPSPMYSWERVGVRVCRVHRLAALTRPHPNPLPEYRERGPDRERLRKVAFASRCRT